GWVEGGRSVDRDREVHVVGGRGSAAVAVGLVGEPQASDLGEVGSGGIRVVVRSGGRLDVVEATRQRNVALIAVGGIGVSGGHGERSRSLHLSADACDSGTWRGWAARADRERWGVACVRGTASSTAL